MILYYYIYNCNFSDPTYFNRVKNELAMKNIFESDVKEDLFLNLDK
jgi:hypothetical protein